MSEDTKFIIIVAAAMILVFICSTVGIINTSNNNHNTSVECIKAGGSWVDGKKCDNN